jgi:hypothetical protein
MENYENGEALAESPHGYRLRLEVPALLPEHAEQAKGGHGRYIEKIGMAHFLAVDEKLQGIREQFPGAAVHVAIPPGLLAVLEPDGNIYTNRTQLKDLPEVSEAIDAMILALGDDLLTPKWGPVLIGDIYSDVGNSEPVIVIQEDGSDGPPTTANITAPVSGTSPFGFRRLLSVRTYNTFQGQGRPLPYKHAAPVL